MTREEAINTVRNIYQTDKEKEALGILIPELAESEDERRMREFNDWLCEEIECLTNDLRDEEDRRTLNMLCYVLTKVKDWLEKQKEQKPAEWSEEDEKIIGRLRSVVNECASHNDALDVNGDYCEGDYAKLDAWLKSLRPQPKWSESDKQNINLIISYLDSYIEEHNDTFGADECKSLKYWLKSLRPQQEDDFDKLQKDFRSHNEAFEAGREFERSRKPSWKPSEEQMEALQGAIPYMAIHNMNVDFLASLHKDLKKL